MSTHLKVLIAEDSDDDTLLLVRELTRAGFAPDYRRVDSAEAMTAALHERAWDVVISDYSMPHFSGATALRLVREHGDDTPFIFVSGTIGEDVAVEAMRAGANDYVLKGSLKRLAPAIERELREAAARRERRREAEIRQSLLEATPLAVIVLDLEGRVLLWNHAAEEMFGWRAEDVLGKQNPAVPPGGDVAEAALLRRVLDGESIIGQESKRQRADGSLLDVRLFIAPARDPDGTPTGAVKVIEDITDALEMERQLLQAQRMEAVGRLAGGVAHDFNNILAVILGESELGLMSAGEDAASSLEEIRRAAERAAVLTRQLLAFSRQQLIEPKLIDVNQLLEGTGTMIRRLIGEDIDLRLELAAERATVVADPGQVEQIVLNLIVNARDAMPDGGRLTIRTRTTRQETEDGQEYVEIAVQDTGIGMDATVQKHLFEAFFSTKEHGKGTGLGLATCSDIVARFNGHILVESAPGEGTTMFVLLPAASGALEEESAPAEELPRGTERILLVEDDEDVRQVGTRMLSSLGYTVVQVPDAARALQALAGDTEGIDLLLTDLVLPGMSGRELADRVLAEMPGLKVLFASGYTDDVIIRHRVHGHVAAWVQKPFSRGVLARKVRDVLDGASR